MSTYCGRIHVSDDGTPAMKRLAEKIEDRIDIAACAYRWAKGVSAYPWTSGLSIEECTQIRARVRFLGRAANGSSLTGICDAADEAALRVFAALPL